MGNAHTSGRHSLKLDTVNKMMRVKHNYDNKIKNKFKSGSVASVTKKYSKDDTMMSTIIVGPDAPIEEPLENILTSNEESGGDIRDDDYDDHKEMKVRKCPELSLKP